MFRISAYDHDSRFFSCGRQLCLVGLLFVLAASCVGPSESERGAAGGGPHPVILVLLDGVRADMLGCYGAAPSVTPTIDAVAAESVRFEWAFAQAPSSAPSLASVLTGLYPTSHGLVDPGDLLVDEAVTVAEVLAEHGMATAAFVDQAAEGLGLSQGFTDFDPGADTLERAAAWMVQHASEDFFLAVQAETAAVTEGEAGTAEARALHTSRLADVDAALGVFVEQMRAAGLDRRASLVVLATTGCELGEHGAAGEGSPYTTALRVPLLVRYPGGAQAQSVAKIVETIDLMPTLLDLAGAGTPAGVQGASLLPLVEGSGRPPYIAFAESPARGGQRVVALGGYAMVYTTEGEVAELYNLATDPLQIDDTAATEAHRVTVLRGHLGAWEKMVAAASLDPDRRIEELDEDTLEQLKSLGYIQ